MLNRLLESTHYLIFVAVLGSLLAAILILVMASIAEVQVIIGILTNIWAADKEVKAFSLALINIVDYLLLATGFYIIALGFYELFIDDKLNLPAWLIFHDFDDLKSKLVGIIIVVLGVNFLSNAVSWHGEIDIIGYGAAVGLVIAALTYYLSIKPKKNKPGDEE
ncbi:MAG: hypothetical protein H6Q37_1888 [Chloroflexi bacterium]|jgi:uncharacterized membrane protein YqhA|nr:hypothetical protein [Chloroflexota bacterium]